MKKNTIFQVVFFGMIAAYFFGLGTGIELGEVGTIHPLLYAGNMMVIMGYSLFLKVRL